MCLLFSYKFLGKYMRVNYNFNVISIIKNAWEKLVTTLLKVIKRLSIFKNLSVKSQESNAVCAATVIPFS